MFSAIRKHLSPATVVAFMALVFAMTGGAFAASSGSGGGNPPAKATASTTLATATAAKAKPKTKAGPRGPAGPAGKNGTNGVNGAPGATGPAGAKGENGPVGAPGAEGKEGKAGINGTNGKNGTTGFTKTLPSGETETGSWSAHPAEGAEAYVPISFNIPLGTEIDPAKVYIVSLEEQKNKTAPTACSGTAEAPTAEAGGMCVYVGENYEGHMRLNTVIKPYGFLLAGVGKTGGSLVVTGEQAPAVAYGTWAVTAE